MHPVDGEKERLLSKKRKRDCARIPLQLCIQYDATKRGCCYHFPSFIQTGRQH